MLCIALIIAILVGSSMKTAIYAKRIQRDVAAIKELAIMNVDCDYYSIRRWIRIHTIIIVGT